MRSRRRQPDVGAVDRAGVVAGQKRHYRRHFFRLCRTPQRNALVELVADLLRPAIGHIGFHQARAHRVHAHTVTAVIQRHGTRQVDHRPFRRAVICRAPVATQAGDRGGVNDTALGFQQIRHGEFGTEHYAVDIHPSDASPVGHAGFQHCTRHVHAGIVQQHVDAAQFCRHLVHHFFNRNRVGNVDVYRQRPAFRQRGGNGIYRVLRPVRQHHHSALGRKSACRRFPHPIACAGDHYHFIVETHETSSM
ncbi:Uncharacterised protein [Serratia plymuthica]|uniref:Uncharacterized protein n=1 Tax=Serratia plymuthica TaxID=82996 RepID=A0A2X4UGY5_SERPL|nr:Uncharacterised protein [Serratia plymuthica]